MDPKIYMTYGQNIQAMCTELLVRADIASRLPQSGRIGLKPNLVVPRPASEGATTHPEILEALIVYIKAHSQAEIIIMEGAWVGASTQDGFRVSGYDRLAKQHGVRLLDLKNDPTCSVNTAIGPIKMCRTPLEIDYLINLPVLKGHCQTVMTSALKNCKGCLPDSEKRRFHSMGLQKPIAALAAALKPDLTIVDSICGDLNFEEGGTPVQTDRLLLGEDMVQLDAFGCQLLGISLDEVPYIKLAADYGAGRATVTPESIVVITPPAAGSAPSAGPKSIRTSGIVKGLTQNVVQSSACSACFGNLVHALYRLQDEGKPCRDKLYIGQDFRGQTLADDGLGIGSCCRGATHHVPGCPPTAEEILEFLHKA